MTRGLWLGWRRVGDIEPLLSDHGRARPGHPRLACGGSTATKTWMPMTSAGMTTEQGPSPRPASCRPVRAHQPDKTIKQVVAVARPRRGLGVVLHREHRGPLERDAAVRSIEQRHVGLLHVTRQARAVDREAVIHRGDLDLARGEVLDRMIGAVMALMHLHGPAADRN